MGRACVAMDHNLHANRKWKVCSVNMLVDKARKNCGLSNSDLSWSLDNQSFEKWGLLWLKTTASFLGSMMS